MIHCDDNPGVNPAAAHESFERHGLTAVKADWTQLPPEAGPGLPAIAGVASMRADPVRGASLYANRCADCHDEDGPGAGEYRLGEERPRIPALWGSVDGYSRGAAFYRTPVLGAYVQKHMPFGDPETLADQDALDIAAFINDFDKPRPGGLADEMYCHDDPDGIPSALRKPADWLVGCEYPGEREFFEAQGTDFDDMVLNGPWEALAAWRAAEVDHLLSGGFQNLGLALAGANGEPLLDATGLFTGGSTLQFEVSDALASAPGLLVLGVTAIDLPLLGGVLVPEPLKLFGFFTDFDGNASRQINLPSALPAGLELYAQAWIVDPGAVLGWSATNAISAMAP